MSKIYLTSISIFFHLWVFLFLFGCKGEVSDAPTVGPVWVVFNTSNSVLRSNAINDVAIAQSGAVWLATDQGAYSYSTLTHSWGIYVESLYTTSGIIAAPQSHVVAAITASKDKCVWFAFPSGEVIRYNPFGEPHHVWKRYKDPAVYGTSITSLTAMRADWSTYGEVWAASQSGLKRFIQSTSEGDGTWIDYAGSRLSPNALLCARTNVLNNTLWFGAEYGDGAVQIQYEPQFESVRLNFPPGSISATYDLAFDADSITWFAQSYGVYTYNIQSLTWNFVTPGSTHGGLPVAAVRAVETLSPTTHWFGTDSGLVRMADSTFTRFTPANSPLPGFRISHVRYDLFGNLWVGTVNGVAVYNPNGTRL